MRSRSVYLATVILYLIIVLRGRLSTIIKDHGRYSPTIVRLGTYKSAGTAGCKLVIKIYYAFRNSGGAPSLVLIVTGSGIAITRDTIVSTVVKIVRFWFSNFIKKKKTGLGRLGQEDGTGH